MVRVVEVRRAVASDAEAIANVHVATWRETYSDVMPDRFFGGEVLEKRRRWWASLLAADPVPGEVVVAERDGEVVGFAFAGSSQHPEAARGVDPVRELHLFSIYLLAAEHGTGTGHALLEATIGDEPAQLWVARMNTRARSFYERHGFHDDGHQIEHPNIEGLTEIRMIR